jgi:hypothetical protein
MQSQKTSFSEKPACLAVLLTGLASQSGFGYGEASFLEEYHSWLKAP